MVNTTRVLLIPEPLFGPFVDVVEEDGWAGVYEVDGFVDVFVLHERPKPLGEIGEQLSLFDEPA